MTSAVVDVHAHVMPLDLLRTLESDGDADLSGIDRKVVSLAPWISGLAPGSPIPLPPQQYDVEARLAAMDDDGVDVQVITAAPFLFASQTDDDQRALDLARRCNDAVAELAARAPDRLVALATVPAGRPGAVEEAVRGLDDLACAGVTVGSAAGRRELDDPAVEEVWELLARRRAFVFLHPSRASAPERLAGYHLVQLVGYPTETALTVARLVFGGVLERHELCLCLAHGGGCLGAITGRLDLGWRRKAVARTVPRPPSEYVTGLYHDTAVFDPSQLRSIVDRVGAARVLFGSDAPFDLADHHPHDTVAALGLGDEDRNAILGGNALRVLALPAPSRSAGP